MGSKYEIVGTGMISFVREKFVQSMARIVQYFCEEVVIHVNN